MAKILESKIQNGELTPSTELRVSILSSFTTQGLDRVLLVEAAKDNVYCNTYVAGYNQYAAEILTAESGLYQSNPQLIFYFVDIRSLFNDIVLNPYSSSEKGSG